MCRCLYLGVSLVMVAGLAMAGVTEPTPPKDPSLGGVDPTCGQCFAGCKFRYFDCMGAASTLTEKENCRLEEQRCVADCMIDHTNCASGFLY